MRYFWATTRLLKPISRGARSDRNLRPENHDSISTCFVSEHFPCSKIDLEFSVFDILNQFQKNHKELAHADFLGYLSPPAIKFRMFKSRITSCASKSITPIRPVRILKFETQNITRFLNSKLYLRRREVAKKIGMDVFTILLKLIQNAHHPKSVYDQMPFF